jgi:hypothetical protein
MSTCRPRGLAGQETNKGRGAEAGEHGTDGRGRGGRARGIARKVDALAEARGVLAAEGAVEALVDDLGYCPLVGAVEEPHALEA